MDPPVIIRRVEPTGPDDAALALLATSDRTPQCLLELCRRGQLFVAKEVGSDDSEPPVGAAIVIALSDHHSYVLAAFAVEPSAARPDGELLDDVINVLRADGVRRLITPNSLLEL